MPRDISREIPIEEVQVAQDLTAEDLIGIGLIRLNEHGNLIEFDIYSAAHSGPRAFHAGHLPPGGGITSFSVADLDGLELLYIKPPAYYRRKAYEGRRSESPRVCRRLIFLSGLAHKQTTRIFKRSTRMSSSVGVNRRA